MMKEINAKGVRGFLLYDFKSEEYIFRVYSGKNFTDYKLRAEEIEVDIVSDYYSFYESENEKTLDFSSKALGKKNK